MSETSAVSEVQLHTQRQLKARGFFSVWGQPVQPHMSRRTGEATLRGHALGVAIASSFPLHQPPVPLPAEVHSTQRLTEGMLRVGSLQLRVITVYGFPSTYVEAEARNQQLLQMALDRIALSRVPTLIGGDMNMSVLDLPIWEQFSHLGYRELFRFMQLDMGACFHQLAVMPRGMTPSCCPPSCSLRCYALRLIPGPSSSIPTIRLKLRFPCPRCKRRGLGECRGRGPTMVPTWPVQRRFTRGVIFTSGMPFSVARM